jgi:vitamin B12 transporter
MLALRAKSFFPAARRRLAIALLGCAGFAPAAFAEPLSPSPDAAQATISDRPDDRLHTVPVTDLQAQPEPEPVPNENLPEIPETFVPGRPSIFPANPLPEDVAVTPTRTETRIGSTGTSLTVITQEEIRRTGQVSVAEVLRGKVGLDIVRSGGPGGQTALFIRGANSQQTKVLLDGLPLNDPSGASRAFDFSTLDVTGIERIEVLRGPQSLLYGSDAIGGVVNIITQRGDGPPQARVSGLGGNFGTGRIAASVSGGDDLKYYSVAGSYLSTDGISAASSLNGNTETDHFKNGTATGRFGLTPSENVNIDYVFRYTDSDAGLDGFDINTFQFQDELNAFLLQENFYNRIQMQSLFLDGGIEQIIAFGLADYQRRDTSLNAFTPRFNGQARTLDYQLNFLLTEYNTFTAGAQYYSEEFTSTNDPHTAQNYTGVFVQDQWSIFENWYVSAGARWDDHSRAGRAETYRCTTLYTIVPTNFDVHASIGTGFRAPALAEFAFSSGILQPEISKGWDIGATQRLLDNRLTVDATYFRNDFNNLIDFNFNTFLLENIGRARTSGLELTSNWQATESTNLYANYTLTDTLNLETGTELFRRPHDKATVGFNQSFLGGQARLGGQMLYVGQRLDSGSKTLDRYTIVNFNGAYTLTPRAELFGRIDNAFNERYVEVANYGTPGIGGFAGLNIIW